MSEIKVSEMMEAESVNEEDLIMIVQDGINKKVPASKVGTGGAASGDTLPIGAVLEWYSDTIPENWLLCNGQEVSRTDYAELFNTLGTKYGTGDGSTTFNLPNLKGKVGVGKDENDEDFNELGKTGGEKKHKSTIEEMPGHTHTSTRHHFWSGEQVDFADILGDSTVVKGAGINVPTSWAGGNQPHNNLQPYITCNFIIKAKQNAGLVATVVDSLESTSETDALSAKQGKVLNEKTQRHIITVKLKNRVTFTIQDSNTKVPLVLSNKEGDKLSIEDDGIKIGNNVKKIKVSATALFNGYDGAANFYIYKNNSIIGRTILGLNGNTTLNITEKVVDVIEGDIIYIQASGCQNGYINENELMSYMTVEVVG